MQHALFVHSLAVAERLRREPNFTFCGWREQKTTTFFPFSWISIRSLKTELLKKWQNLTKWTGWNKRDKVWSSANALFKWRFRSRCRRSSLLRAYLHGGGRPQIDEVTCGGSPQLTCKCDQIKMRDFMDRRVTSPKRVTSLTWGSPPLCKQALKLPIVRLSNLSETLPRDYRNLRH